MDLHLGIMFFLSAAGFFPGGDAVLGGLGGFWGGGSSSNSDTDTFLQDYDFNHDGKIETNELGDYVKRDEDYRGLPIEEVIAITETSMSTYDKDNDRKLNRAELGEFLKARKREKKLKDNVFRTFDDDEDGKLNSMELVGYVKIAEDYKFLHFDKQQAARTKFMNDYDKDKDGKLDRAEFGLLLKRLTEKEKLRSQSTAGFKEIDTNGNGAIEFVELKNYMSQLNYYRTNAVALHNNAVMYHNKYTKDETRDLTLQVFPPLWETLQKIKNNPRYS